MKFYLIVVSGKKQGMPIPIEIDLFLIGTAPVCQLRSNHPDIGDQHCALLTRGRKVFVTDLDSGHPTYLNHEVMTPGVEWPLHSHDHLEIGPLHFMVQYREKGLSQKDLEEWALNCLDQSANNKKVIDRRAHDELHSQEFENASNAAAAILAGLTAQRGEIRGRLRISHEGEFTIVRINDVHLVEDAELALISHELQENLKFPNQRILIDMKNVKRLSYAAAEMLGGLRRQLKPIGSRMAVCRLTPEFTRMVHEYPSTHDLPIYADKPKAMGSRW
jgi:anti-anti-sigma regulatory factor